MATPIKMYQGNEVDLQNLDVVDGQLIFTTDTNKIYLDNETDRLSYYSDGNDVIINQDEPENTEDNDIWLIEDGKKRYTKLNYIETDQAGGNNQYINTGYNPNGKTGIEMKASNFANSDGVVFGGYSWNWEQGVGLYSHKPGSGTYWFHYFSNESITNVSHHADEGKVTIKLDKNTIFIKDNINNSKYTSHSGIIKDNQTKDPLYIFAGNFGSRSYPEQPISYRLYYFRIYDNDELIKDFIPVLDDKQVPCLYDKIGDEFYYNQGAGQFKYG